MAGFKMPIVCKEIFLPEPTDLLTLDQYKEEYGIDLRPYIRFIDAGKATLKMDFCKVFIVLTIEEYSNIYEASNVIPASFLKADVGEVATELYYGIKDTNGDSRGIILHANNSSRNVEDVMIGAAY